MLAIRMQRTGRKGHAMFRVVVQDSRRTPTSGRIVAALGSYDPHTKTVQLQKDKAGFYLENGAQPSERVVRLFQAEGIALPKWVTPASTTQSRNTRNPEKLRKNQPKEAVAPVEAEAAPEAPAAAETSE
jgi:small subunit ribosomal protein S16